jgi:hypothetical protein
MRGMCQNHLGTYKSDKHLSHDLQVGKFFQKFSEIMRCIPAKANTLTSDDAPGETLEGRMNHRTCCAPLICRRNIKRWGDSVMYAPGKTRNCTGKHNIRVHRPLGIL